MRSARRLARLAKLHRAKEEPKALVAQRLSKADFDDLCWLRRQDYRGDVGEKSNMGDIIDRLERSCPQNGPEAPNRDSWHVLVVSETLTRKPSDVGERMFDAATKLRRLSRQWKSLAAAHREVLDLAYRRTHEAIPAWHELGAIALMSPVAKQAHARAKVSLSLAEWLGRLRGRPGYEAAYSAIRDAAELVLLPACRAWEQSYRSEYRRKAA